MGVVWLSAVLLWLPAAVIAEPPERSEPPPAESAPTSRPGTEEDILRDQEDMGLLDLEIPTVVTAARREQPITHVAYAVSVITAEDIRRSGARSVPDALRLAPGVDVADLTFGSAAVSVRASHGFLSNKLLVLVDGRQIFDSFFGGTLWSTWPFQLEDIERIEVIRGPGGVTWGANAVNGVINIITKDPADQVGLTFTGAGGPRGTHKEHLGYAFADEKLRFRVSGEFEASEGFRRGGSFLRHLEDSLKSGRIGVHAIYEAGANDTLTFSAGSCAGTGGAAPPPMVGSRTRRSGGEVSFLLAKWAHQIDEDNTLELTGYVNDSFASPGIPSIDYRYQQFALQFGHTFEAAENHTLSWGIDSRVDLLDGSNADPFALTKDFVSTAIIGLYLQDKWRIAPKWTLSLGGRIDYEFYGGFQPSARAALAYELSERSMVYGAVSRAFHMPPAAQRFADIPLLDGIVRLRSHRDLDSQSVIAYELGYRARLFERLDANLNLFWHEYADLTTFTPMLGPPGLMRIDYDNRAAASVYGVELDARFAATKKLTLLANYTFQQPDWRSRAPYHETDTMSPPQHKFSVGARLAVTDDLDLSGHLYYVDAVKAPNPSNPFLPRHVAPYFRLDLRAEHEFWNDQVSVAVGVRNLLDSHHYEGGTMLMNDAEVPRMLYAELSLRVK